MRYLIRNVLRDYPAFSVTEMVCTMPPRTSIKSHRIAFNIIVLWTVKYGRLRCGGRILIKRDRNSSFGGEGEGLRRPTAELKTLIITSYETRFRFTTNTVGWTGSIDHRAALHTSRIRMCGRRKSTADFQMVPKVRSLVTLYQPGFTLESDKSPNRRALEHLPHHLNIDIHFISESIPVPLTLNVVVRLVWSSTMWHTIIRANMNAGPRITSTARSVQCHLSRYHFK